MLFSIIVCFIRVSLKKSYLIISQKNMKSFFTSLIVLLGRLRWDQMKDVIVKTWHTITGKVRRVLLRINVYLRIERYRGYWLVQIKRFKVNFVQLPVIKCFGSYIKNGLVNLALQRRGRFPCITEGLLVDQILGFGSC